MSGACRKTFAWDENHHLRENDVEIHLALFKRRNPLILVENRQKFGFYVEKYTNQLERCSLAVSRGSPRSSGSLRMNSSAWRAMWMSAAGSSPRKNDGLLEHLAWPGISAKRRDVPAAPGRSTGALLLEAAGEAHADILIMGGYGHRPWREALLGGVTREILGTSTIPLLLAH
jgi:hypothetical protein